MAVDCNEFFFVETRWLPCTVRTVHCQHVQLVGLISGTATVSSWIEPRALRVVGKTCSRPAPASKSSCQARTLNARRPATVTSTALCFHSGWRALIPADSSIPSGLTPTRRVVSSRTLVAARCALSERLWLKIGLALFEFWVRYHSLNHSVIEITFFLVSNSTVSSLTQTLFFFLV